MVRMYYLALIRKQEDKADIICTASDLSDFNFFRKGSAKEFMRFCCQTLVERTAPDEMISVQEQTYICHALVRSDNLAAAAVTDNEYSAKIAHICLYDLLCDFIRRTGRSAQEHAEYQNINAFLQKFKEPTEATAVEIVQSELDETKIILHHSLQSVLQRGEKLDDLVTKADNLSTQAKAFYRTAKKTNSCCSAL